MNSFSRAVVKMGQDLSPVIDALHYLKTVFGSVHTDCIKDWNFKRLHKVTMNPIGS